MSASPRPRFPLSDRERMAVQLYGVTAASADLRHHQSTRDAEAFRDFVRDVRALRDRAYGFLPFVSVGAYMWALQRLDVRTGRKPDQGYWVDGERLTDHTLESDLAFVLVVAATKWTVLGLYRLDDARYALAQRRGARLAKQMLRDGTLSARSPRKVVRMGGAR